MKLTPVAGSRGNRKFISIVVVSTVVLATIFILWPSKKSIEPIDRSFQEELEFFKYVRPAIFGNNQEAPKKNQKPLETVVVHSANSNIKELTKTSVRHRETILKQDNLCEAAILQASVPEVVASLGSKEIQNAYEILKTGKSDGNGLSRNSENFLKALYFSGMLLEEPQSSKFNIVEAESYWRRLFQDDPKNGAVPFFYIGFLQKKGSSSSEMIPYVAATVNAEYFKNYYFEFTENVWDKSLLNSSYYLQNVSIIMSAPYPDYIAVMNGLKAVVTQTQDQALKASLREWILNRAKQLQRSNGEWEGVEWSRLEYVALNLVAKKMGFELPDLGNPRKLSSALQKWRDFYLQALTEIIKEENEGRCQPEKFKYFFKEEKERYLQMKAKKRVF